MDNPFSSVVQEMLHYNKSKNPASFRMGTVLSEVPLKVDVAGLIHDNRSLLKNSSLNILYSGDRLLLVPIEEEQRYIIICKVVSV